MVVSFSPLCVSEAFLGPSFFTLTLFLSILTGEQTDMYGVFVCFVHVRTVPYVFLQQRLMSGLICRVAQRSSFNLSFPLSGVKVDHEPENNGWKLFSRPTGKKWNIGSDKKFISENAKAGKQHSSHVCKMVCVSSTSWV